MNRSVLLVIVDFFILTLLSFVQFDQPVTPSTATAADAGPKVSAPAMSNMLATLQAALEIERQQRQALTNALAASSAELERRMQLLAEREQRLTDVQDRLSRSEGEQSRLAQQRAALERSQAEALASVRALQQAFETTQRGTESLQDRLIDTTREAAEAKARLQAMQQELERRQQEASAMQERISKLDETQVALREEKQQLLVELRETEVEARTVRSQVTNLNQQLVVAGQEKAQLAATTAQLATNVGSLAQQSTAIQEQIERQIRLPANTIYGGFLSNRINTAMTGSTRGAFGQTVVRDRAGATVLFRAGGNVFAALHVDSTPLRLWPPDAPWTAFTAELSREGAAVAPSQFALVQEDPRIVVFPVDAATATSLGVQIYDVTTDPAQFAEAVIVGAEERYYGETNFRLSARSAGYVEMERSTFRRLLGEFAPKKGDLAFTRTGQLLGIMVNGDHCLLLHSFSTLPAFRCANDLNTAENSAILRTAFSTLERQPGHLR